MALWEEIAALQNAPQEEVAPAPWADMEALKAYLGKAKVEQKKKPIVVPNADGGLSALSAQNGEVVSRQVSAKPSGEDEFRALRDKLAAKTEESLNLQGSGISQMEQALQDMKTKPFAPQDLNLAPLAAYFDNLTGGNISKGITAPETPEAKQDRMLKLQAQIQGAKEGLTESEIANLRAQLQAHMENKADQRQSRFEASQERALFNQARKEQTGLIKEATDFKSSYANVEDATTPDANGMVSVGRVQQSLSSFAKLMGEKGVLTDTDIGRQLKPTIELQLAGLEAKLASDPNAKVSAKNVAAIKDALATAKRAFSENYKLKSDSWSEGYFNNPGSPYGGKQWSKKLVDDVQKAAELVEGPRTPTTPAAGGGFMSPEDFFKNRKKGP